MKNCGCHTEINTDGSGQLQRYLKELDPSYIPIDGRSIEDILVYAKRYATQIRFYDITKPTDNEDCKKISWREFFRRDMAVIIASVSLTDLRSFQKEFTEIREKIELNPTPDLLAALFNPIVGMLKKIDRWYSVVIPENPLYNDLAMAIESDLRWQAIRILSYKKNFNIVDPNVQLKIDLDGIENPGLWGLYESIPADDSLYQGETNEEQILYAALNVEDIFYSFYSFLSQLVAQSNKYLVYAIKEYPGHQPHMALFITFLELFRLAQEQMNGLTERMLNFYYRDILRLSENPSLPDKAHIVFELAKEVAEYNLEKGSALSAGNDASGKEQIYVTENDFVINQAKVAELKTIFVEKHFLYGKETKEEKDQVIHSIYARPVANSQDGFGEKFTDPDPKWYTFGVGNPPIKEPKNICEAIDLVKKISARANDQAQIGFAIASPQLLMEGGKRLVQVIFNEETYAIIKNVLADGKTKSPFEIWFTGEKKWFKINRLMSNEELNDFNKSLPGIFNPEAKVDQYEDGSYYFDHEKKALCIYLPIAEQAVINYNEKLHKDFRYTTALPVMQIRLNAEIDLTAADYQRLSVKDLALRVKVGSINPKSADLHLDGLKKLVLQTENGLQQAGKSFDPFSPYPAKGKFFYIGSTEIFNKPFILKDNAKSTDELSIMIEKTSGADAETTPIEGPSLLQYKVEVLTKRDWVKLSDPVSFGDFKRLSLTSNILNKTVFNAGAATGVSGVSLPRLPIEPVTEWEAGTEKGFLKITNLIATANGMEERQKQAASMEIAEISLNYDSTLYFLENSVDEFYHVYPFGNVQVYPYQRMRLTYSKRKDALPVISNNEDDPLIVDANLYLLPHFAYIGPYEKYSDGAAKELAVNDGGYMKKITGITATSPGKKIRKKRITEELMLNASGLRDKLEGEANQYSSYVQEEGILQIGIENLKPLQTVSLLFQFAEGSAEDEDKQPPDIHWSYLTNNEWRPLKGENIVADGTFGFMTTGIVKISLPEDATDHSSICTDGLHWLSASVTKNSNLIPQLVNIVTQATEVTFTDNQNDPSHFDNALPAESITKLINPVPDISKVSQPFASFDGKRREIGKEFYTRVSERLRHKHRAITPWDYEHIVLDRFPSVYKVKCITHTDPECLCRDQLPRYIQREFRFTYNTDGKFDEATPSAIDKIKKLLNDFKELTVEIMYHTNDGNLAMAEAKANEIKDKVKAGGAAENRFHVAKLSDNINRRIDVKLIGVIEPDEKEYCCGPQVAPGHVLLVPIANLKNRNAVNPLQPKTARRTLLEIESYLTKIASPFIHIHAKNPVYEQVLVFFRVKFYPQYEIGYYLKKLNEEIVQFLTPWAFDENADVKFGQKIYASSIINFIEERKYVDFITDFNMIVCKDKCCTPSMETKEKEVEGDIAANIQMEKVFGNTSIIKGTIKDKDDKPLPDIKVTAGGTELSTKTDASGNFTLDRGIQHNEVIELSMDGFKTISVNVEFGNKIELVFKKGEDAILNEWGLSIEKIERLCGCSEVEYLLQDEMDLPGDIVAKPSTARSILVSAPQHIIVPYKEPPYLTPCEKKKLLKEKPSVKNGLANIHFAGEFDVSSAEDKKKTSETKGIKKSPKKTGKKPNK